MAAVGRVKKFPGRLKRLAKAELRNFWQHVPLQENTVLYESFSGNGMLCHPEAIFKCLLSSQKYSKFKHIWVLNDFARYADTIHEYRNHSNVKFVKYLSMEYYHALATSKYLVNNVTFPTHFIKREGQVYLNTWHGIPLKKMGYDIKGKAVDAKNIVRNFVTADYLLSASKAMTEEMYFGAFKLKNIYNGTIITEGNPRVDRQWDSDKAKAELRLRMTNSQLSTDERKIVLYAPTWKGESYFSPHNDGASLVSLIRKLESRIDKSEYRILIKAHQIVSESISQLDVLSDYLVPNSIPTNIVLGATDILVTDYSSIFFDYLATERPVLFYLPDLEEYKLHRDLYLEPEELPGPIAWTLDELADQIAKTISLGTSTAAHASKYEKMMNRYLPKDDGKSCQRIVDIVFDNNKNGYELCSNPSNGKVKLLIYVGGMAPNGITTSALNLLDNIDYSKFDVTVLCPYSKKSEQQQNFAQINSKARLMFRFGTFSGGYIGNSIRLNVLKKGLKAWGSKSSVHNRTWEMEWKRCFGESKFDHMIDFSGYTAFWGLLFMHGPKAKKSIWLHNDLAADAHRSIDGSKPLKEGLFATFSIYNHFDNLVSVSEGLCDINRKSLAQWAPDAKFSWASNTINGSKITRLANKPIKYSSNIKISDSKKTNEQRSFDMSAAVSNLLDPESKRTSMGRQITRESAPFFTFVSAGRLSPEKNHKRLINAFAYVHAENPLTRLVIAGSGPLRELLTRQIVALGLTESVKLVGHTKNPYQLMKNSDAFVLSSDYEGQPMVLLEALVLGIPVITTSFGSVKGALPKGIGKVVAPNAKDLAEAMLDESMNPSIRVKFDSKSYNLKAINEFESIVAGQTA